MKMVAKARKLPVPNFCAGGIATPADASLVMQLGAEAVFVGSGIFMNDSTTFAPPEEAERRAKAIVRATTHFNDPKVLLEVSEDAGSARYKPAARDAYSSLVVPQTKIAGYSTLRIGTCLATFRICARVPALRAFRGVGRQPTVGD